MGCCLTMRTRTSSDAAVYKVLDVISNLLRSIPFIILLIVLIPFTQICGGKKLRIDNDDRPADDCSGTFTLPEW